MAKFSFKEVGCNLSERLNQLAISKRLEIQG